MLGLCCCTSTFFSYGLWELLFVAVFWLLIAVACLKAQALGHVGSVVVAHRLSCPSRNPPGPVIQQVSPALRGRFLTTQPSGELATIQSHHCYPCFYFLDQYFFFFKIYLVSLFWLCWLFIAVCRLSVVAESGSLPWLQFLGFSLQWILLLGGMGP